LQVSIARIHFEGPRDNRGSSSNLLIIESLSEGRPILSQRRNNLVTTMTIDTFPLPKPELICVEMRSIGKYTKRDAGKKGGKSLDFVFYIVRDDQVLVNTFIQV
jgi:hypothetical protein